MAADVNVIGAGFSGLMLSYYLNRAGYNVSVFEKEKEVGGLLKSPKTEFGLVEHAANGMLLNAELQDLCQQVNIDIIYPSQLSKNKYIYFGGKKTRWPFSFYQSFILVKNLLKLKFNKSKMLPNPRETLRNWGERVFNKLTVDALIEPAFLGVYASPASELSAQLVTKNFFSTKTKNKKKVKRQTVSFTDGLQGFCSQMKDYLEAEGVVFNLNNKLTQLNTECTNFICTDPNSAASLLKNHSSQLYDDLNSLDRLSIAKVAIFSDDQPSDGFGCLFSRKDKIKSLGVIFDSNLFPTRYKKSSLQTWIVGSDDLEDIKNLVSQDMKYFWGKEIKQNGIDTVVWQDTLPKYNEKLELFLSKYDTFKPVFKRNYLFANYCGDLGLSQILVRANKLVEKINL